MNHSKFLFNFLKKHSTPEDSDLFPFFWRECLHTHSIYLRLLYSRALKLFLSIILLPLFITSLTAQPLSAYRDGRIKTFSYDNQYQFSFQDQQGFIWGVDLFGKVIRYNGYEVEIFPNVTTDSTGVQFCSSASVQFLQDSEGKIWLSHQYCGLDRFDPQTGQFEHFNDELFAVNNFPPRFFSFIFEDSRKVIWICTQTGLYKYSHEEKAFSYPSQILNIDFVLEDNYGNIWEASTVSDKIIRKIGHGDDGAEEIDFPYIGDYQLTEEFLSYGAKVVSPRGENFQKIFYISTFGNLYSFDVEARKVTPRTEGLLPGEWIYTVFDDGITLVGTNMNRLMQYDHKLNRFITFLDLPELPGETDPVIKIFRTKEGLLWVVTKKRTFQVLPQRTPIQSILYPDNIQDPASWGDWLVSFKKNIYFNTTDGLQPLIEGEYPAIPLEFSEQDFAVPELEMQKHPNEGGPKARSRFKFIEDSLRNNLWLLLCQRPYGMKLFSFDEAGRKTFQYYCSGRDTCWNDSFQDIDIDSQGRLWIAGWRGVSCLDPEKPQFTNYTEENGLIELTNRSILCDRNEYVWIGTNSKGLTRYNIKKDCFDYFLHDPTDLESLSSDNFIEDIHEDHAGNIWVVSMNGLNRFDSQKSGFKSFFEKDGLPSNDIFSVIEDDKQSLWMQTAFGITKFKPEKKAFYTFGELDGWQQILSIKYDSYKDEKGRLFFAKNDRVLWFHPDSLQEDTLLPELVFTDFQLANQSLKVGDSTGILSKSIAFTDALRLKYSQNVFTIRYTALEYLHTDKITYAFQLEGFDEDWRMAGKTREATYTNLSPGDYRFKVKCRNHHGFESDPISLDITILPPWYRTWWAYGLWLSLLGGALYAFYRFQLNRRLAQAEARQLREFDAVKTRLYTNITHEFRTPLTIIKGIAGQLQPKVDYTVREELKRIQRNGQQLLHLVNQMLDLAKVESGSLPVNRKQGNIIPFLKYLLESFHPLAEAKHISLHFQSAEETLVMDYDEEKMRQIVGNLLSNAVKFTGEGGWVKLEVTVGSPVPTKKAGTGRQKAGGSMNWLQLSVSDTGAGISEEKLPHIFSRFYQADDSATRRGEGTGIGLTLTKELVKLLSGEIEVESKLGKGSIFTVLLPITKVGDVMDVERSDIPPLRDKAATAGEDPTNAGAVDAVVEPAKAANNTLLIIEDNVDVTHYLSSLLKKDYTLLTAPDGRAGLEAAQQEMPDLILCDVMMPKMDGFEVCRRLKGDLHTSHIPVVLLTAKADIGSRIEGIEQGADAYLAKPFEERELKARLKKLLDNRERLRAYYTSSGFISRQAQLPNGEGRLSPADREFFDQLLAAVQDNLGDPAFSAEQLAGLLFVSYATCLRKVKALTGQTVKAYIRYIRIHRAAGLLLEDTGRNIGAIATDTGFNSNTHFTREFRKVMGCTPSEYRKRGG